VTLLVMSAIAPAVALIALGVYLRSSQFLPDAFWAPAEKLSYQILLPALLIHGLSHAELADLPVGRVAGALIASTTIVAAALVALRRQLAPDDAAFTSVFQGGVRFNNYIGVTAAVGLFGEPGLALAAVANAAIIPTVNILCVLVFALCGGGRTSVGGVLRSIVANPLVIGSGIGIALLATGTELPTPLDACVRALGLGALPLGLLCVGAALDWTAIGEKLSPTLGASLAKFVAMPLVTALICVGIGLDATAAGVAVLFQALPTASSSYVMASRNGGDVRLMAAIIAFQTVTACVTIPAAMIAHQALT
jgi:predicted permease